MKVYVHLAKGFEEIEAISTVDILRRAEIDVSTVSVTGKKEVMGAFKTPVMADLLFEEAEYGDVDMIVLPGGLQGTKMLEEHEGLKTQISSFVDKNKWVAAICAAPTILGKMGMLEGREAVCYPGHEQHLKGSSNPEKNVVVDGKIITSRGPGTSFEFALKLVEVIKNQDTANTLRSKMIIA